MKLQMRRLRRRVNKLDPEMVEADRESSKISKNMLDLQRVETERVTKKSPQFFRTRLKVMAY